MNNNINELEVELDEAEKVIDNTSTSDDEMLMAIAANGGNKEWQE